MKNLQLWKYALALLRKTFKCKSVAATTTFDCLILAYGLRIKIKMDNLFWIGCIVILIL
jgi:hypothetical protein